MVRPRIWAPRAKSLRFHLAHEVVSGVTRAEGWWECPVELAHGDTYRIQRDDGPLVADARSVDLPEGLDGPTRVFDPTSLSWSDDGFHPAPWPSAILYELHVGTFTEAGTLDAAIERLDHLASLGITHVELMPLCAFEGERGWGYDGVFPYSVHATYGGPSALARFVDAAHTRGLGVILDVVYNHIGPGAERLAALAPYFDADQPTPWGPSFDLTRPEVRAFVRDNAVMWRRDFHIDGLRLDAVQVIRDAAQPHILAELSDDATGHDFVVIAETIFNDRHMVQPREEGGFGLDAHWHEDFHHALHAVLTGERVGYYADYGSLEQLATILRRGYWFDGSRPSRYHGRAFGEPSEGLHGKQCVAYLQTHDQIGNRADGARIDALVGSRSRIGSALTLLGPFVPMLYAGEEWATSSPFHFFSDHGPPVGPQVQRGRRDELARFGFDPAGMLDPEDPSTTRACVLQWDELAKPQHADTLRWYRDLIALRRRAVRGAVPLQEIDVDYDEDERWLKMKNGPVEVAVDFSRPAVEITVSGRTAMTFVPTM